MSSAVTSPASVLDGSVVVEPPEGVLPVVVPPEEDTTW